jgi:hypothetical protein
MLVVMNNQVAVYEGALMESQTTLGDVEKEIEEAIRETPDKYGDGRKPIMPPKPGELEV